MLEAAFAEDAELARYRPWFAELRKAKPYQLEDRVEELFHDKSVTAYSAWNRLFDETMASLKFDVDGEILNLEATLHLLSERDEKKREAAYKALAKTLEDNGAAVHPHHQCAGQGQGNLGPLARLPGYCRQPPHGQFGGAGSRRCAAERGARGLSAAEPSLLQDEGQVVRQGQAQCLGPQCAAAHQRRAHLRLGDGQEHGAGSLWQVFAEAGGSGGAVLRFGLDRCAGERGQVVGRLRASDRAERPSLSDAQLSGAVARRDDAGP